MSLPGHGHTAFVQRTVLRLALLAAVALACAACATSTPRPFGGADMTGPARQLLLVVADGWDATTAELRRYERGAAEQAWTPVGAPVPVNLGRGGLGWGRGLHGLALGPGPVKREGDGRAPAGLFRVGPGFAYAPEEVGAGRLEVLRADADLICVDGMESAHYNRIVRRSAVAKDWKSVEEMRRPDGQYQYGALVAHNIDPVTPGAGSCIFLHIWLGPGVASSGCTNMAPEAMLELLRWLDADKAPVLAQLPRSEFLRFGPAWRLPAVGSHSR